MCVREREREGQAALTYVPLIVLNSPFLYSLVIDLRHDPKALTLFLTTTKIN